MINYKNSDYARNKYSKGIVYQTVNGSRIVITLDDFLTQNPGKTEKDFNELKEISDSIYLEQVRAENTQTRKNINFRQPLKTIFRVAELC